MGESRTSVSSEFLREISRARPPCSKFLQTSAPLPGTCRVCQIHCNVCNRSRAGSERDSFVRLEVVPRFSRALVKSTGRLARRAFRSIGSPRNVIALPANPRQVSTIYSLLRFGLLAFDSSTTNHRRRHARWFSKWLLHPISLSRCGIKTAINHRAIYQIIE